MQRARFTSHGTSHFRGRLSQLSPRISARLSQRRKIVAVGSDEMDHLAAFQNWADWWPQAGSPQGDSSEAGASSPLPHLPKWIPRNIGDDDRPGTPAALTFSLRPK